MGGLFGAAAAPKPKPQAVTTTPVTPQTSGGYLTATSSATPPDNYEPLADPNNPAARQQLLSG
jgi:hypothetical protein